MVHYGLTRVDYLICHVMMCLKNHNQIHTVIAISLKPINELLIDNFGFLFQGVRIIDGYLYD